MDQHGSPYVISTADSDGVVSAARTAIGDDLRSVIVFTPATFAVVYARSDLYGPETDLRSVKAPLVDLERVGFAETAARTAALVDGRHGSDIGPYGFTVRFHEAGYVVRLIEGDVGVLLTTDSMDVRAFREAATAVRGVLAAA